MKRLALLPAFALALAIVPFATALPAHASTGGPDDGVNHRQHGSA
jgi:hypothetical protein